ncbi:DUF779 domain-containing protein [Luteococcus sp. H138]|uniref:DUF779 domain-containing protein n=1 Tax=unclassified Luteococcus TaxID=2639923 RepID=UPI00313EAC4A
MTHETPEAMTMAEPVEAPSADQATSPGDSCSATSQAWWQELPQPTTSRVGLTRAAAEVLARLVEKHGPVMFHQSGGCCDGSAPMCYPQGDFLTGDSDVLLGRLAVPGLEDGIEVWISRAQFRAWQHTHLTIDAVKGRGAGFSLESPEGVRFLTRSRLLTDEERAVPVD